MNTPCVLNVAASVASVISLPVRDSCRPASGRGFGVNDLSWLWHRQALTLNASTRQPGLLEHHSRFILYH